MLVGGNTDYGVGTRYYNFNTGDYTYLRCLAIYWLRKGDTIDVHHVDAHGEHWLDFVGSDYRPFSDNDFDFSNMPKIVGICGADDGTLQVFCMPATAKKLEARNYEMRDYITEV